MSSVTVYCLHVHCMPGQMRRPIPATHGAVVLHAPYTAGDDERYASQGPAGVDQRQGVLAHRLDAKAAAATAPKLTRQEVLHLHTLLVLLA